MTEKLAHLGDGKKFLKLFHRYKKSEPVRASRYRMMAKIAETFGWHNEDIGGDDLPKPGRPAGSGGRWYASDLDVVEWALAEIATGARRQPYGLARRYWREHPNEQRGNEDAFVQRVGSQIAGAIKK